MENGIYLGQLVENELPLTDLFYESVKDKIGDNTKVIAIHYSNYGGSFLGKMLIKYFQKEYPNNIITSPLSYNGEEAVLFGPYIDEINDIDDIVYTTGIEDFIFVYENDIIAEKCDEIINERFSERDENEKHGIYMALSDYFRENANLATFGLDYSEHDLDKFILENIR